MLPRALALLAALALVATLAGCATPGEEAAEPSAPQLAVIDHVRGTEVNVSLRQSDSEKADAYRAGAVLLREDHARLLNATAETPGEEADVRRYADGALAHARWYETEAACLDAGDAAARPCQDAAALKARAKEALPVSGEPTGSG